MSHGSYGVVNKLSPCMKEGKYSKYYPTKLYNTIIIWSTEEETMEGLF